MVTVIHVVAIAVQMLVLALGAVVRVVAVVIVVQVMVLRCCCTSTLSSTSSSASCRCGTGHLHHAAVDVSLLSLLSSHHGACHGCHGVVVFVMLLLTCRHCADAGVVIVAVVSQSVDLGRSNNPNTTPTKDYKIVRVVVYLRGVQRGCAEEGERGSTPTG